MTDPESKRPCVMIVHAHPDDEVFSGGLTLAKYAAEGAHTVLVTCTNGECGQMLDPQFHPEDDKHRLGEIRIAELRRSAEAFGIETVELLGYRDSGMWEWPDNAHPDCFNQADIHEAVGRMVALIRRHQPDVIATYNVDGGYPHPDHLMAHTVTAAAYQAAADPTRYLNLGGAWSVAKLYALAWSRDDMHELWWAMKHRELKWPWGDEDQPPDWGVPDHLLTAKVDVRRFRDRTIPARAAHRSQLDPNHVWYNLPEDLADLRHRFESFVRLRSRVNAPLRESDLFEGITPREFAAVAAD